jgi:hypothetical protein
MIRAFPALFLFLLTWACTAEVGTTADGHGSAATPHRLDAAPPPTATFDVVAWVDDPNPTVGSRVILHGSLLKDGVHLGGMAMRAIWPEEGHERGVPNCSVQVIYGAGVCSIESEGLQTGVYVPITVTFEYQGQTFRGGTGFTPR